MDFESISKKPLGHSVIGVGPRGVLNSRAGPPGLAAFATAAVKDSSSSRLALWPGIVLTCLGVRRLFQTTGTLQIRRDTGGGLVAQWIRHRPTEPGIAGSSPAGVIWPIAELRLAGLHCTFVECAGVLRSTRGGSAIWRLPSKSSITNLGRCPGSMCLCGLMAKAPPSDSFDWTSNGN